MITEGIQKTSFKCISSLVFWVFCAGFMARSAEANFTELGVGARPLGMGNAFSALANDSNAMYYNPAGLAALKNAEVTSSYARLLLGLADGSNLGQGFLAGAVPFDGGTVGFSYLNMFLAGAYQENTAALAYAKELTKGLSVGVSAKALWVGYTVDEYLKNDPLVTASGNGRWGFALDVGVRYRVLPMWSVAVVLKDINQPNMAVGSTANPIPMSVRMGTAYRYDGLDASVDVLVKQSDWRVFAGAEKWLMDRSLALRGGVGLGSRDLFNLSVGTGYRWGNYQVDYAFLLPLKGLQNTSGSHRFSVGIQFGTVVPESQAEFGYVAMVPQSVLEAEREKRAAELSSMALEVEMAKARADAVERQAKEEAERSREDLKKAQQGHQQTTADIERMKKEADQRLERMKRESATQRTLQELLSRTFEAYQQGRYTVVMTLCDQILALEPGHERATQFKNMARSRQEALPKEGLAGAGPIPRTYTVQAGDTLVSIARKIYGDENRWEAIFHLNKDRLIKGMPNEGQVLELPENK